MLGAGIAGLAVATDLAARGFDVMVLEAQSRPGGRVLTIRSPFPEGLYVEAGATHVTADPDLLALVATAGVSLVRPKPPRGLVSIAIARGERLRLGEDEDPPAPYPYSEEERKLGFMGRLEKYFALVKGVDPASPWPPPALARHDLQTGVQLLTELGASPGYVQGFGGGLIAERLSEVSGAFVLREMAGFFRDVALPRETGGRIAGGSDRLPHALAEKLGARVVLSAEVQRITQDEHGARVTFVRGGEVQHVDADRVVCTIPYSVLRHLEIAPALSAAKRRVVHEMVMVSYARVLTQLDRRFWNLRGESGDAETDLPLGDVKDETKSLPGIAGVLGASLTGDTARRLSALSEPDRVRAFVDHVDKVHPGARSHLVSGLTKCWDEDRFARGAFAWFRPRQLTELGAAITSAEGRIHFAGDHTSHRPGWMHGAVASAKRAVAEILASRRA